MNYKEKEKRRNEVNNNKNSSYIWALVVIIFLFLIMIGSYLYYTNNNIKSIKLELANRQYPLQILSVNTDSLNTILSDKKVIIETDSLMLSELYLNTDVDKNILLEIIKEVKYFNEIMNQKQNDTIRIVIYILGFLSIIAAFFGYRTINDIRMNAKNEMEKISKFYGDSFNLLNEQSKLSKEITQLNIRELIREKDKLEKEQKVAREEYENFMKNIDEKLKDYDDLRALFDPVGKGINQKREEEKKEEAKKVDSSRDEFNEED